MRETRGKIKEFLEKGLKPAEIAKQLGISRQAVYTHRKKLNSPEDKSTDKDNYSKKKAKYIINWQVYNEALVIRGEFMLHIDILGEEQELLDDMNERKEGKKFEYSDTLMDLCRTMKSSFQLDFRSTEGICRKLFGILDLKAPDYTTMCKRFSSLESEVKEFSPTVENQREVEIAIDGTGRSQNQRGFYRESKYKITSRSFVRFTIAVDVKTKEVKFLEVTTQQESEIPAARKLIQKVGSKVKIKKVYMDKLHDSKDTRGELISKGTEPVIPARDTMDPEKALHKLRQLKDTIQQTSPGSKQYYSSLGEYQRFQTLIECSSNYEGWRDRTGYGKRSMSENFFSRDTSVFGDSVSSKRIDKAKKEMIARTTLLNLFITLARSRSKAELISLSQIMKQRVRYEGGFKIRK